MIKPLTHTLVLISLAACGGGGGGSDDSGGSNNGGSGDQGLPGFADANATGTVSLSAVSLDSGNRSTSALTGTLDRDQDTLNLGDLSGDINNDRSEVTLDGGGQILLTAGANEYSRFFDATPSGDNRTIGIVGILATNTPTSGDVTYNGTSMLTIQEGVDIYDLTGTSNVQANFGDGLVTSTIDDLSGTQRTGLTGSVQVNDVATITFSGSEIDGTTFSGGTVEMTSDTITALSDSAQSSLNGAFFGPDAAETGGAFVINDADDDATILGTFIAN